MTVNEILQGARELIALESAWIQTVHARDELGAPCWPGDGACQWCLVGAVEDAALRILPADEMRREANIASALDRIRSVGPQHLAAWNDAQNRTHAEVLALLDRAIAA